MAGTTDAQAGLLPRRRPDVDWAVFDGQAVLHDPVSRRLHRLNPSATVVWQTIEDAVPEVVLVDEIVVEFGLERGLVEADLHAALEGFADLGLLDGMVPSPEDPSALSELVPPGLDGRESARVLRRLDALEWPVRLGPYRALGARFGVRLDEGELAGVLEEVLAPLADPSAGVGESWYSIIDGAGRLANRLWYQGRRVVQADRSIRVFEHLLWHINRAAVLSAPSMTVFHAAGASFGGEGLLLPASMNSGKSTLVAGLIERGFDYLSDEAIGLDPVTGALLPYPKSLTLDPGSWRYFPEHQPRDGSLAAELMRAKWQVPPDRIHPGGVGAPAPLAYVVSPRYEPNAPTTLDVLGPGEVLALLIENSFHLGSGDRFERLVEIARTIPGYRLVTSDLVQACDRVCALVGAPG